MFYATPKSTEFPGIRGTVTPLNHPEPSDHAAAKAVDGNANDTVSHSQIAHLVKLRATSQKAIFAATVGENVRFVTNPIIDLDGRNSIRAGPHRTSVPELS